MERLDIISEANAVANDCATNRAVKAISDVVRLQNQDIHLSLVKKRVAIANEWIEMDLGYDPGSHRIDFLLLNVDDTGKVTFPYEGRNKGTR